MSIGTIIGLLAIAISLYVHRQMRYERLERLLDEYNKQDKFSVRVKGNGEDVFGVLTFKDDLSQDFKRAMVERRCHLDPTWTMMPDGSIAIWEVSIIETTENDQ